MTCAPYSYTLIGMTEKWRPVLGYEGFYSASDAGRIRREKTITRAKAGHVMKLTSKTYVSVGLSRAGRVKTCRVHRLIWEAFNGAIPQSLVINHIDGNPWNNNLKNLDCVTVQENILHAFRVLGRTPTGEKLTAKKVTTIRKARAAGASLKTLAQRFGVTGACIAHVATGKTWKHAGGPIIPPRAHTQIAKQVAARISDNDVLRIIKRYNAGKASALELASEYDVNVRTIYNWVQGRARVHLNS